MLNYKLNAQGFSPPPLWLPQYNSRTGSTSSSPGTGAVWEDRAYPLLHSYQHLEFHINGKGILQSKKK